MPQYHINANVTGGSEKTNYYLSVAHTGQDAMMRDFKYERTNLQLNIDTKITDRLRSVHRSAVNTKRPKM